MVDKPAAPPQPPPRLAPSAALPFYDVWQRVRDALMALPGYFRSETSITGLHATDIFTLGATLGATIEDQVVSTLNAMRAVWDPDEKYALFRFIRQPQTFPDVLLARRTLGESATAEIAFGIELKSWYLLAKEAEPSFRYLATARACADLDLLVIVPWFLSNVISGSPVVLEPYIESSQYAALYRNFFWSHVRQAKGDASIVVPKDIQPYPKKSDNISDHATQDTGKNFGRIARTGLIESYVERMKRELVAGIEARYWLQFFKMFQEHDDPGKIAAVFKRLEKEIGADSGGRDASSFGLSLLDAVRQQFSLD